MEVHGGLGVLAEYGVERWLREAMILAIWEGTAHRQVLDGLEVMERKQAHKMLFDHLAGTASDAHLQQMASAVQQHLQLSSNEKEAQADALFRRLAVFVADSLSLKYPT
jgi:Acyl-CoA dehydrogenase, C-terminal domain